MAGESASALSLSRPAQASLTLRPIGSLSRPRRPLSRGSSPASCPAKPLVSFRTYRQLSGWNPPPQVFRAFGAHCQLFEAMLRALHRAPNQLERVDALLRVLRKEESSSSMLTAAFQEIWEPIWQVACRARGAAG